MALFLKSENEIIIPKVAEFKKNKEELIDESSISF